MHIQYYGPQTLVSYEPYTPVSVAYAYTQDHSPQALVILGHEAQISVTITMTQSHIVAYTPEEKKSHQKCIN